MKRVFLDARDLEHPKPLERAIEILRTLDEESYLYMIHRKYPIPLIELSKSQGFAVYTQESKSNEWHILISKNGEMVLAEYLDV